MRVGDLVRDTDDTDMIGIVVGAEDEFRERWYVKWLTGYWQGNTTSRWIGCLEVVSEKV